MSQHSPYYNPEAITRETAAGRHREAIGGLWDELGRLQLDFLIKQGMQPQHYLLDIGCGALRLGVKALDYLESGHYFGADISNELMEAGYQQELSATQRQRLPRANLHATADFDFSFLSGTKIDYAIAQSVFTHLPFNHIRRCLAQLAPHLSPGATFYATAWLVPESHPVEQPYPQPGAINGTPIITTDIADPYHYRLDDFKHAIRGLPYSLRSIGHWDHPRGQPMLGFQRV